MEVEAPSFSLGLARLGLIPTSAGGVFSSVLKVPVFCRLRDFEDLVDLLGLPGLSSLSAGSTKSFESSSASSSGITEPLACPSTLLWVSGVGGLALGRVGVLDEPSKVNGIGSGAGV